jgi:hypothetical protein
VAVCSWQEVAVAAMTETASRWLCRSALVGEDLCEAQNTGYMAKLGGGEVEWTSAAAAPPRPDSHCREDGDAHEC